MTEQIRSKYNETLLKLKNEIMDKPQGYTTRLRISGRLFPEMDPPYVEIVLLDPEDETIAYRRTSDPLRGERKGNWSLGDPIAAIEDAYSWRIEMENEETLRERLETPFTEDGPYPELFKE